MKLQITNAKQLYFQTKENYLAFRKAWADAVNSPDAKPRIEEWERTNYFTGSHEIVRYRVKGNLTATHHLVFNLLRGKDATVGFTPITNKTKLVNGMAINHGLYWARYSLAQIARQAKSIGGCREIVDKFLAPFCGTVTVEMLIDLDLALPSFPSMDPDFGKGRKIAEVILKGEQQLSMSDVYNMYEEVA